MSDGGRGRASLGVEVWKSSQKWRAQRSAVRSIAWLDVFVRACIDVENRMKQRTAVETTAMPIEHSDDSELVRIAT